MTEPKSPIVIACSADWRYIRPLATTLVSALAHVEPGRWVDVHVIDGNIPDADKYSFARSLGAAPVSLSWHDPNRSHLLGVPLWGRMPISVYDKLLVPDLLRDTDQALWLDSDTLVLGDVGSLWDQGASGHPRVSPVLAVQDPLVPFISSRFGVARYRELGLRGTAKYFNAGVMLMNLALWRQERVSSRALEYVKNYARDVTFWDQEGLNAVLAGEWGELDAAWNWSVNLGRDPAQRTIDPRAKIVHFSGNLKPWKYDGRHSYYRLYYDYVDRTAWAGTRPMETWRAAALRSYERSALRRVLNPAEQVGTGLWMSFTRRLAAEADVRNDVRDTVRDAAGRRA